MTWAGNGWVRSARAVLLNMTMLSTQLIRRLSSNMYCISRVMIVKLISEQAVFYLSLESFDSSDH